MTEILYRNVTDSVDDLFERGHRERDDGTGWSIIPNSDWVKTTTPMWFIGHTLERMRAAGVETTLERATEFEQAIDSEPYAGYFYLANAAASGHGDEALKWIMGAIAAELNVRKLPFTAISSVVPANVLNEFVRLIAEGKIDRTFTKPIFTKLVEQEFELGEDPLPTIEKIISDPQFQAVDETALEKIIDKIIADNPDQFAKAKENPKLVQWFLGQIMKATQGKVSAVIAKTKVEERLYSL